MRKDAGEALGKKEGKELMTEVEADEKRLKDAHQRWLKARGCVLFVIQRLRCNKLNQHMSDFRFRPITENNTAEYVSCPTPPPPPLPTVLPTPSLQHSSCTIQIRNSRLPVRSLEAAGLVASVGHNSRSISMHVQARGTWLRRS